MDEREQLDVNEKLLDSSSSVEETTICDPIGEDTSDHATESEHVVLVEVTMKEENDGNKTLDNGRVPSAVEGVEESSITAGVHQQQLELSEDARPDQQEPTNCQQEDTLSGNLDNMKTLQYVVVTTLYPLWEVLKLNVH